jgi:hypothetical protein
VASFYNSFDSRKLHIHDNRLNELTLLGRHLIEKAHRSSGLWFFANLYYVTGIAV